MEYTRNEIVERVKKGIIKEGDSFKMNGKLIEIVKIEDGRTTTKVMGGLDTISIYTTVTYAIISK